MLSREQLLAVHAEIDQTPTLREEETDLLLVDVDPRRVRAFWRLSPEAMENAQVNFGGQTGAHLVIRYREVLQHPDAAVPNTALALHAFDRELDAPKGDLELDLPSAGKAWEAELGLTARDGGWRSLARSNRVQLPPLGPSRKPAGQTLNIDRLRVQAEQTKTEAASAVDELPPVDDPSLLGGGADELAPVFPNPWPLAANEQPIGPASAVPGQVGVEIPEVDEDLLDPLESVVGQASSSFEETPDAEGTPQPPISATD